ncbi:hypothetical protein C8J57DRAFT_1464504 [Mycena rebaudengoi]|nr:hypothetical protein C8J57DRAFT_1464504 [Mycena rebaudengoi]
MLQIGAVRAQLSTGRNSSCRQGIRARELPVACAGDDWGGARRVWVITEPTEVTFLIPELHARQGISDAVTLRLVQEVAVVAARVSRDVVAHAADSGSPGFNERRRRWTPLSAISGGACV